MYYIYHITGVKIGCSKQPDKRIKKQGYTDYEILEEHMDKDVAAEREIELQKQYGYKVDKVKYNHYDYSKNGKIGGKISGKINGKIAGKLAVESGRLDNIRSKESTSKGGRKAVESGRIKEIQKKAAEASRIPISAYRKDTGEYIGTYKSQTECADTLGLNFRLISFCIKGRLKSTGGYTFKREPKP